MKRTFSALIAIGGFLLFIVAGQGVAHAQGVDDPAQAAAGQMTFETTCAGCHGEDGSGTAIGRPLIGIASQGERDRHVASVTGGRGGMPAFGERLSAEEIEAAVSYVRLTFVEAEAEAEAEAEPEAEPEATEADPAAPEALAETGVESGGLAIIGAVMLAAGLQLVIFTRRHAEA